MEEGRAREAGEGVALTSSFISSSDKHPTARTLHGPSRPPSAGAAATGSSRALAASASFSTAALNTSSSIMNTLAPPPPLQPYEYEPGGSVGASLKGPAAELYGATRPQPAGPRRAAGARPASAPRAGAGGAASYSRGSDGPRVGRAALERYIVREDISAVRGLY